MISTGHVGDPVRPEIENSWRRSAEAGLKPEGVDVPFNDDIDSDSLLVRAATPILDELVEDLSGLKVGVVLTDSAGHVIDRRVEHHGVANDLDRILLAPGFVYAEGHIGTNAIGTALAQHAPSLVIGAEHFADAFTRMACAAAPVLDPRTRRLAGLIDLTCRAPDVNPLLLPLVRRAAREVQLRLREDRTVIGAGPNSVPEARGRPRIGWTSLTETERSVVALATQGVTNREMAALLYMSRYTVDSHMRSIYGKLGINSRVALTRLATDSIGHSDAHDTP